MLVMELIEKLQKLDEEKEVVILYSDDSPLNNGNAIQDVFEINGSNSDDYVYIWED